MTHIHKEHRLIYLSGDPESARKIDTAEAPTSSPAAAAKERIQHVRANMETLSSAAHLSEEWQKEISRLTKNIAAARSTPGWPQFLQQVNSWLRTDRAFGSLNQTQQLLIAQQLNVVLPEDQIATYNAGQRRLQILPRGEINFDGLPQQIRTEMSRLTNNINRMANTTGWEKFVQEVNKWLSSDRAMRSLSPRQYGIVIQQLIGVLPPGWTVSYFARDRLLRIDMSGEERLKLLLQNSRSNLEAATKGNRWPTYSQTFCAWLNRQVYASERTGAAYVINRELHRIREREWFVSPTANGFRMMRKIRASDAMDKRLATDREDLERFANSDAAVNRIAKHMPEANRKELMNCVETRDGCAFRRLEPPQQGYHFAFVMDVGTPREQRWFLSLTPGHPHYFRLWKDVSGTRIPERSVCCQLNAVNTILTLNSSRELRLLPSWVKTMRQEFQAAEKHYQSELSDQANIRNFDLPKHKPVGYISLVAKEYTRNRAGAIEETQLFQSFKDRAEAFPQTLNASGYSFVQANEKASTPYTLVDRNPEEILNEQIAMCVKRGIDHVFISLFCHGSNGFSFPSDGLGSASAEEKLTYAEMMAVFRRYPQVKITVDTVACHGGKIGVDTENLRDHADAEEGRVTILTHTKSDDVNFLSTSYEYGTDYHRFLMMYASRGMSYGRAHLMADRAIRRLQGTNPEVWRSSRHGSGYETAAAESPEAETFEAEEGETRLT